MIGLLGAHRCGKTTLARAYAEKHQTKFVETSVSAIFRDLGYDPAKTYDFSTRLTIQEEVLKRVDAIYATSPLTKLAITDRTPLDMLAYTMGDAVGDRVKKKDQERFRQYAHDCIEVVNKRFNLLVVIQPGIKLVQEKGKAALNEAYIEHLNSLMLGLSVDERIELPHFYLPRQMTNLEDRLKALEYAVNKSFRGAILNLEEHRAEGGLVH